MTEVVEAVVEQPLLGGPRRYTRAQVAELSGVSIDRAMKLWVALGFAAAASDDEMAFTDDDIAAVRQFTVMDPVAGASEQSQIAAARTVGQAMARLAEWQADLIAREIGSHIAGGGRSVAEANRDATARTIAVLARLQEYAWQRHLAAALTRSLVSDGATRQLLVGFACECGPQARQRVERRIR
ncbi:hypothetical protein IFM12275_06520 [Nocardia sputorum]|nr:hypothetical protein IFM12275_06520 [Nocardia sputorum]